MAKPSYRILVVEDDPTVLDLFEAFFNGELSTASSLSEARLMLKKEKPDLMILDRILPDGDGIELCEEVRRDPALRSLPLLLLTCKIEPGDRVRGLKLGADDYLTKPFAMEELKARVEALLRRTVILRSRRKITVPLWKY